MQQRFSHKKADIKCRHGTVSYFIRYCDKMEPLENTKHFMIKWKLHKIRESKIRKSCEKASFDTHHTDKGTDF